MKYFIFLELLVMSMRGGMTDTSSDVNPMDELVKVKNELNNILKTTSDQSFQISQQNVKSANQDRLIMEQNAKIANQDRLIMEQNAKIANQDRLIMEQNAKIANQDRLIMEHRMSNAVHGNSVLQTQNNLLERSLSSMQQCTDQQQELLTQITRLETLNETVMGIDQHQVLLSQQISRQLETLNETVMESNKRQYQDIQRVIDQSNDQHQDLLSQQVARLETLNETVMEIKGKEAPVIAFWAFLHRNYTASENRDKIVFDRIQTNIGKSYNDGVFTVPMPALYVFQWTIVVYAGRYTYSYLMVNGKVKAYNYGNNANASSYTLKGSSTSAVLTLKTGDRVWIVASSSNFVSHYSSFQGWLQNEMW